MSPEARWRTRANARAVTPLRIGLALLLLALFALPFADLSMLRRSPWPIAASVLSGFLHHDYSAVEGLGMSTALTHSFAFWRLSLGSRRPANAQ